MLQRLEIAKGKEEFVGAAVKPFVSFVAAPPEMPHLLGFSVLRQYSKKAEREKGEREQTRQCH